MKHRHQGNVLAITLIILAVAAILAGTVVNTTMTVARNANRSRMYLAAQAAADGAVEYAYAVWLKRTNNKHNKLSTSADFAVTGPSFSGTSAPPGTPGFVYTSDGALTIQALDKYGVPLASGTIPDGVIGPVPGYPGWWGTTYTYAASAKMQPASIESGNNSVVAGARRLFQYTEVSMFQTMYFFQHDLEIYNPAYIVLNGMIHTNGALYLSNGSGNLTIKGQTSTAGTLPTNGTYSINYTPAYSGVPGFTSQQPPYSLGSSNYNVGQLNPPIWNNGTTTAGSQLHEVAAIQPLGTALDNLFADSNYANNPNVKNGYHELIEPPDLTNTTTNPDPSAIAQRRLYNQAGLIIKVSGTNRSGSGSGTAKKYSAADIGITTATVDSTTLDVTMNPISGQNFTVLVAALQGAGLPTYDTTKAANQQSTAYNNAVNDLINVVQKQLATDSNAFYDQRVANKQPSPAGYVNVVNVDVGKLNTFITNDMTGNFNGVLYVYDNVSDTLGSTSYNNTVRLENGKVLPSTGLTVATQNPIYIQGDYNTGYNAPSTTNPGTTNGADSTKATGTINSSGGGSYTRQPAAVIGDAIMLLSNAWLDSNSLNYGNRNATSTTYNTALLGGYMPSQNGNFSGGAVNYPRYLENWTGDYCTYWGSMVELFPSKIFTQLWQTPGTYYSPPTRLFNFDPNYLKTAPPGSVCAIVLSRGAWSRY